MLKQQHDLVPNHLLKRVNIFLAVFSSSFVCFSASISDNVQRHENLLRWAVNLTRDCDVVENRLKYFRPGKFCVSLHAWLLSIVWLDGTQPFDFIPIGSDHLQHDDGNIRSTDLIKSRSNHSRLTDQRDLPQDRAAAKIQAAYRGYSVRKSLPRLNEKSQSLDDQFNRRVNLPLLLLFVFSWLFSVHHSQP